MKKSFEVNLGGRIFNFDEDAYELLNNYIESLKGCFAAQDGGDEIIADIEVRLGELCETRMREGGARIVDFAMIDEFISRMGSPETFAQETVGEQRSADEDSSSDADEQPKREPWRDAMLLGRKFFRDTRNGLLGGVFSGLATYIGFNVWLLRILAILICFFVAGVLVPIVYVIAWLVFPMASSITDLMRMRDIKPASGERVEAAWAREYERALAEVMNGGVARENKGCLSGCVIILLAMIAFPIIVLLILFDFAKTIMPNLYFGNQNIFATTATDCIYMNYGINTIILSLLIFIPIFFIIYYILKRKNRVSPLKEWIKILLVALWIIALGLFLCMDKGSATYKIGFPLCNGNITYSTKKESCSESSLDDVIRFVNEVQKYATSPEALMLKKYFLSPDNYPDSKNCTRILWHYITSAGSDSLVPFASECTLLDDRVVWSLMPRDEWMEYIDTPASVSKVEIAGGFKSDADFSVEICCVVDTVAKRMFIDLPRCKGADDLQIAANSIPGWSVDFRKDSDEQLEQPHRVELLLKLYSEDGCLPKMVVSTLSPDNLNVNSKDIMHTLYKQRLSE